MIRQIVWPDSEKIVLNIPKDFVGHRVEVIAFQIEEEKMPEGENQKKTKKGSSKEGHARLMNFIKMHPIKLPKGYKFNRESLYE